MLFVTVEEKAREIRTRAVAFPGVGVGDRGGVTFCGKLRRDYNAEGAWRLSSLVPTTKSSCSSCCLHLQSHYMGLSAQLATATLNRNTVPQLDAKEASKHPDAQQQCEGF